MNQPSHSGSCTTILVLLFIAGLGSLGWRLGGHWGTAGSILGAILGVVVTPPAIGLLLLPFALIEKRRASSSKDETHR